MDILVDGAARQRRREDAGASLGAFDSVCELSEEIKKIEEDVRQIEEDSKKINCYAIFDLIYHSLNAYTILLNVVLK